MRKLLILGIAMMLACDSGVKPSGSLEHQWQWLASSGGFAGQILTPATTGDEIVIEFTARRFIETTNGTPTDDLRYEIKLEESIYSSEPSEVINYSNNWRQSFRVSGDTLYLVDECYDCFSHTYVKIKGD